MGSKDAKFRPNIPNELKFMLGRAFAGPELKMQGSAGLWGIDYNAL